MTDTPAYGPSGHDPMGFHTAPRPGIVPLRPLGLGDLYGGAFAAIRANPGSTLLPAFLVAVVVQVVQLVARAALHADAAPTSLSGLAASFGRSSAAGIVVLPFVVLLGAALSGVLTVVVHGAVLGRRTPLGQAWGRAAPRLPGVIGVSLLIGLLVGIVAIIGTAMAVVVGIAIGRGPGVAVGVLLGLVVLVAVIYVASTASMALPAYVLEGIGVTAALTRSRDLVRGAWWSVFGVLALTGVAIGAVGGLLGAVVGLVTVATDHASGFGTAGVAPGLTLATAVLSIALTTVTSPFSIGVFTLLYTDRRIRRERYDLELATLAGR